jgi:phage shock protein PspC (stress-responsive transcriptional regulator)
MTESQTKAPLVGKKWTRSREGWIGGVCGGMAKTLNVNVTAFRLLWAIGTLCFGLSVLMYFAFWALFPREDKQFEPDSKILFGVCLKIADRFGVEVSWVRILTVLSPIPSFGTTVFLYIVLAVLLPEKTNVAA